MKGSVPVSGHEYPSGRSCFVFQVWVLLASPSSRREGLSQLLSKISEPTALSQPLLPLLCLPFSLRKQLSVRKGTFLLQILPTHHTAGIPKTALTHAIIVPCPNTSHTAQPTPSAPAKPHPTPAAANHTKKTTDHNLWLCGTKIFLC
jgi:hypothetical protein